MEGSIKNLKIYGSFEDFKNVFFEFRKKPYFEDWKDEDVRSEYNYLKENGEIFFKEVNNQIIGLVTLLKGIQEGHGLKIPTNNVGYISDIAVLEEFRRRGYGTELMQYAVNEFKKNGNEYAYFRTLKNGSLSEPIGLRLGFETVYKNNGDILTQLCSFPRINNCVPEKEERKFLVKKLL